MQTGRSVCNSWRGSPALTQAETGTAMPGIGRKPEVAAQAFCRRGSRRAGTPAVGRRRPPAVEGKAARSGRWTAARRGISGPPDAGRSTAQIRPAHAGPAGKAPLHPFAPAFGRSARARIGSCPGRLRRKSEKDGEMLTAGIVRTARDPAFRRPDSPGNARPTGDGRPGSVSSKPGRRSGDAPCGPLTASRSAQSSGTAPSPRPAFPRTSENRNPSGGRSHA